MSEQDAKAKIAKYEARLEKLEQAIEDETDQEKLTNLWKIHDTVEKRLAEARADLEKEEQKLNSVLVKNKVNIIDPYTDKTMEVEEGFVLLDQLQLDAKKESIIFSFLEKFDHDFNRWEICPLTGRVDRLTYNIQSGYLYRFCCDLTLNTNNNKKE
jgi:hypothetical protein